MPTKHVMAHLAVNSLACVEATVQNLVLTNAIADVLDRAEEQSLAHATEIKHLTWVFRLLIDCGVRKLILAVELGLLGDVCGALLATECPIITIC